MPYGMGFNRGFGFRGCYAEWPYIGRGRGGLPRCFAYRWPYEADMTGRPPVITATEVDLLKNQARTIKQQLEVIESRIQDLEKEKKVKEE